MTVTLKGCLSHLQTCQRFGLKSRENIQRLPLCEAEIFAMTATKLIGQDSQSPFMSYMKKSWAARLLEGWLTPQE